MSFIGNSFTNQTFVPQVDYFNGNASNTAFTLSRNVASAADVQVVIENVPQNPSSAFTVSGNVITFTSAPPSGTNNIYVRYTSPTTNLVKPAPGTVSNTEISSAFSLWNLSGADINYTAGNVGIGTASPTGKLNVVQNGTPIISQFNRTDAGTGLVIAADSSGPYFRPTTSSAIRWNNSGNTVEYMRIDSNGNIGIGATSPWSQVSMLTPAGGTDGYFGVKDTTYGGDVRFGKASGINNNAIAGVWSNNEFLFYTNGTERMRISSGGNFLVGGTTPIGTDGNLLASADYTSTYRSTGTSGAYIHAFASDIGGTRTVKYAVYANGTVGAVSDQNFKKNIEPARNYLADLMNIEVVKYNWKSDEENAPKELGYIAQQVETVFAGMVDEQTYKDGNGEEVTQKMLKKEVFVPMLLKAIQEQQAIIEDLKSRIEVLEAK